MWGQPLAPTPHLSATKHPKRIKINRSGVRTGPFVSFDGWWLRTRGLADSIAADCGYCMGQTACSWPSTIKRQGKAPAGSWESAFFFFNHQKRRQARGLFCSRPLVRCRSVLVIPLAGVAAPKIPKRMPHVRLDVQCYTHTHCTPQPAARASIRCSNRAGPVAGRLRSSSGCQPFAHCATVPHSVTPAGAKQAQCAPSVRVGHSRHCG